MSLKATLPCTINIIKVFYSNVSPRLIGLWLRLLSPTRYGTLRKTAILGNKGISTHEHLSGRNGHPNEIGAWKITFQSELIRKRQAIHLMHRKFEQAKSTGLDAPNTRASGRTAETNRHVKVQQKNNRGPNKGPDDVLIMSGRTISQVGCTGP